VTDVVQVGDPIHVKVIEVDRMGRINLSKVAAERELGLITEEEEALAASEGGGDRDRGGDRGGRDRGGDRGGRGGDRRGGGGGRPGGGGRDRR
jgi:polyribonucleotide nucleotidyltransferase